LRDALAAIERSLLDAPQRVEQTVNVFVRGASFHERVDRLEHPLRCPLVLLLRARERPIADGRDLRDIPFDPLSA
jgi:hypothetical protein